MAFQKYKYTSYKFNRTLNQIMNVKYLYVFWGGAVTKEIIDYPDLTPYIGGSVPEACLWLGPPWFILRLF